MPTITISLPESLKTFIEAQVNQEGFGTVSEYLRALVREEQRRQTQVRLESLLLEGLESRAADLTERDWTEIRAAVRERVLQRQTPGK